MSTRSVLRASVRAVPKDGPGSSEGASSPVGAGAPSAHERRASSTVTNLDDARRAGRARSNPGRGARAGRGLDAVRAASGARVRRCSRPGCGEEARATLTFSYENRTALLGPLRPEANPAAYDLCGACSDRMSPPRGWQLADERPPVAPTPLRRTFDERDTVAVLADALHGGATRDEQGRLRAPDEDEPPAQVEPSIALEQDLAAVVVDAPAGDLVEAVVTDLLVVDEAPETASEAPETVPEALDLTSVESEPVSGALEDVPLPGFEALLEPRPVRAVRDRDAD